MPGELIDNHVFIKDQREASQIYNKGYHGEPMSGGGLKLTLIEAALLLELGRVEVFRNKEKISIGELINYATKTYPQFEIKYIVYRDFRQRGYVVKPDNEGIDFKAYKRGDAPNKANAKFWVSAVSERAKFSISNLSEMVDKARRNKKIFLIGVVDEEGDLTYYRVIKINPTSRAELPKPALTGDAVLLEDRVMVWDEKLADNLLKSEFYGKPMSKGLQLSLAETRYLLGKKILCVNDVKNKKRISISRFRRKAKSIQPDFDLRFTVYDDLKNRGMIVKTGFKYGAHFRVYGDNPDKTHSKLLVHSVPKNFVSPWPEISRAVRLAHGVKKEMLFARVVNDGIEYIRIGRVRP